MTRQFSIRQAALSGILASFASAAFAGALVNNGGKVVVCRDASGAPARIELFDYFEARELRGWQVAPVDSTLTVQERVDAVLDRWAVYDSLRAARFKDWNHAFLADSELISSSLPDVRDQEPVMDPPAGCSYEQIVIQRQPVFAGDKRYFINAPLFNSKAFTDEQKAGLILHEIIYREAIGFGAENSIGTRYLNALFSADKGADVIENAAGYFELLKRAGFKNASYQQVWIDLRQDYYFYPQSSVLAHAAVVPETEADTMFGRFKLNCRLNFSKMGALTAFSLSSGQFFRTKIGRYNVVVEPHIDRNQPCDDGFDALTYGNDVLLHAATWLTVETVNSKLTVSGAIIFRDGKVLHASKVSADTYSDDSVTVNGVACPIQSGEIYFHEDEHPSELFIKRCRVSFGQNTLVLQGGIQLEPQGQVEKATLNAAQAVSVLTEPAAGCPSVPIPLVAQKSSGTAPATQRLGEYDISFYSGTTIAAMTLGADASVIMSDGSCRDLMSDTELTFDAAGRVTRVFPRSFTP